MKYGLLMHKPTLNIGDDIQSYAIKQFLPHVDHIVDREVINKFKGSDDKPVAIIMAAWWMWNKWNWPPSKYVLPHFVGFHYSDNKAAKQAGCPANYLFLSGLGADYLNAYGPVGCRDYFTRDNLRAHNINAEFSGCITLTLPQQKKIKPEKEYVCLVDVHKPVEKKVRAMLKDSDIEIKVITHDVDTNHQKKSWEQRMQETEELLTLYQNAKCVVTRRLHCALPCLAMGVPTLLAIHTLESIRFIPYYDWLHCCLPKDFASGKYEYDVSNPPPNPTAHLETRENLINSIKEFVDYAESLGDATADEVSKFPKNPRTIAMWRNRNMRITAKMWNQELKKDLSENERKTISRSKKKVLFYTGRVFSQNNAYNELLIHYLNYSRRIFNDKKAAELEQKRAAKAAVKAAKEAEKAAKEAQKTE